MDARRYRFRSDCEQRRRPAQSSAGWRAVGRNAFETGAGRGGSWDCYSQRAGHCAPAELSDGLHCASAAGGDRWVSRSATAAISLGLVGYAALAERLGRNQRFASTGALVGAGLMGLVGYLLSYQAIFVIAAALGLPLLAALSWIRAADIHFGQSCGAPGHHGPEQPPRIRRLALWQDPRLLVFSVCLFLFQLANASVLPLAGEALVRGSERSSSLIISALIIVPQILVALMAPWVGRRAQSWGRRPLLLIGFAALPIRALGFALVSDPLLLIGVQMLDGISATVLGVLTALVIADITTGTGRFNLAQGVVGTASGIGASISTTLSGLVAERFGSGAGFSSVAATALVATVVRSVCLCQRQDHRQSVPTAGNRSAGDEYLAGAIPDLDLGGFTGSRVSPL